MKQCCYDMESIGLECRCSEQREPKTITLDEILKFIVPTHNNN